MMRIMFGALLGLLLAFPTLWTATVTVVAWLASQPVLVAFAAGILARPYLAREKTA